jgi:predicted small secreted protein
MHMMQRVLLAALALSCALGTGCTKVEVTH